MTGWSWPCRHLVHTPGRGGVAKSLGPLAIWCRASSLCSAARRCAAAALATVRGPSGCGVDGDRRGFPPAALSRARRPPAHRARRATGSSARAHRVNDRRTRPVALLGAVDQPFRTGPRTRSSGIRRARVRNAPRVPRRLAPPRGSRPAGAVLRAPRHRRRCRTTLGRTQQAADLARHHPHLVDRVPDSARTARSHTSSSSTCSATARWTGSARAARLPRRRRGRRPARAPTSNRVPPARRPRPTAGWPAGQAVRAASDPRPRRVRVPTPATCRSSPSPVDAVTLSSPGTRRSPSPRVVEQSTVRSVEIRATVSAGGHARSRARRPCSGPEPSRRHRRPAAIAPRCGRPARRAA